MIDSMRFKCPGSSEIYNSIKSKGVERLMWDYVEDTQKHVLVYQLVPLPNQLYKVYIQAQSYDNFFIEFSLPKVYFDTNIFMIYPKQFLNILLTVQRELQIFLNLSIEPINTWIVQRVDYCYVWKFPNHNIALWVLQNLAKFQYPRKGLTIRDTSLKLEGSSIEIGFYLKQPEFKAKDYKKFVKNNQPLVADFLLEQSDGSLRFEIVYKKAKLNSMFGREVTYVEVLDEKHIIDILNDDLKTFCNADTLISTTYPEAISKIYSTLSKREAYNLVGFLNMWYSFDMATREYNRKFLKDMVSPSTISDNKKKLRELDIGILFTNPALKTIDLSIPNKNVINTADQVAEIAVAIRDKRLNELNCLTASSNSS